MAEPVIKVTVRISKFFKFLLIVLPILARLRLLSIEEVCKVVNYSISKGAYKMRVGKGEWKPMTEMRIDVEEFLT